MVCFDRLGPSPLSFLLFSSMLTPMSGITATPSQISNSKVLSNLLSLIIALLWLILSRPTPPLPLLRSTRSATPPPPPPPTCLATTSTSRQHTRLVPVPVPSQPHPSLPVKPFPPSLPLAPFILP
ncbi:hypothetical protein Pmani_014283 [Petrolisthes manimaculis]|uniref:Uncharacterized protein n=1 Tax=Petrolisthes manimaculis TaxID=1843537 RepID=A0AAE1PWK5_9EUCA|nr:hypothetical protein Pmani_014283 [Petrolisthes manimaculis]